MAVTKIKKEDPDFDHLELSGAEYLPIILAPEALRIMKSLIKDEVQGASDAFVLYLCISQWNMLGINWDQVNVTEELGFKEDYTDELIDFLMELDFLRSR